ncbi:glycosyltransferase [Ferribacterium limneticum]|uniref:glycosyltransferase n=1 Tax=Ferribacterium limneticum TaxID=76259 RepID=UPI001CFAFFF1|nr:glycosyltransferase [Ferribacterium limneticum]UCV17326.1 glycosyltransferase [Ferribacterium limneticum]
MGQTKPPNIVVLSSLFPSSVQPGAGLFIRERMFRIGRKLPLTIVAPTPWFPLQNLIRRFKPHFRPGAPRHENQSGIDVWFPRFFSVPGVFKKLDGPMMALCALPRLRRLKASGQLDIIDAHFAYPDGYAASLLSRWLSVPFTITLRGTETRHVSDPRFSGPLLQAINRADQVFSVSESLRQLMIAHGTKPEKIEVVGNGVDTTRFAPQDKATCRQALDIPAQAKVLISVGGLVPRKGFHRVIEVLPFIRQTHPDLIFLVVGGASTEGNNRQQLEQQVKALKLEDCVRILGPRQPHELSAILSAADVFVLATSNEGWANVFLEAMACGLPVVTTDVGGNKEVVCDDKLGIVVPFGDSEALCQAIASSLNRRWDNKKIRHYAEENAWDERVNRLNAHFLRITNKARGQNG